MAAERFARGQVALAHMQITVVFVLDPKAGEILPQKKKERKKSEDKTIVALLLRQTLSSACRALSCFICSHSVNGLTSVLHRRPRDLSLTSRWHVGQRQVALLSAGERPIYVPYELC